MPQTILIVDDSASLRTVVKIALSGAGYDVLEASDGQSALRVCDGRRLALVVSDVNMPGMNGLEFVTELKKLPAYKFTPVVMLTTEAGDDMKQRGQAAGARAWITKPFRAEVLLAAVQKLVQP
jgi:two-component system chemotaxis response regulator CheY